MSDYTYSELPLKQFADWARCSSDELGALQDGALIDYETGKIVRMKDQETALFLASARGIVLELVRRVVEAEKVDK